MKEYSFLRLALSDGDGNPSSMRLICFLATLPVVLILVAIAWQIFKGNIEYTGLAVIIGACAAYFGAIQYGKVQQTKIEDAAK